MGQGAAIVQARTEIDASGATEATAPPWAVGGGMQLAPGTYQLAMWFDVPRAQEIDWTVSCPGVQLAGTAGETLERYRERRLAELRDAVQRDRAHMATMTSAVVGAVAPRVELRGAVGPVRVHGHATVNADAVGDAVAVEAIPHEVMLPAGDVGRGRLAKQVHVTTTGAGQCVVTAIADDASVIGSYQVTRVRDLDAEARLAVMTERSAAITARGRVQARLVAHGADAELREREAAERRHAAALELRVRAEREEQWRITALHARAELRGRCEGNGADPRRRARIEAEREQQRVAVETQHRIALEAEVRLRADVEQRRLDLALHARDALRGRLVRFGAVPRPPMPAALAEDPGPAPFPGAVWTPGTWVWINGRWEWRAGYWSDPDVFHETGGSGPVEVVDDGMILDDIGIGVGVGIGAGELRGGTRDHRDADTKQIRDHRDRDSQRIDRNIRDHRDEPKSTWTPSSSPRDQGDRDNAKDSKKDDDDDRGGGRMIRDHRR